MSQIESIYLRDMRNGEHFQFMTDVDALITTHTPAILGITAEYPDFKIALSAEDAAMRVERGSSRSGIIEQDDDLRDRTWRAIEMRIESTLLSPIEEEAESARILDRVINLYGDPRDLNFNEESGVLDNLITDLQKPENANHLTLNCITTWVSELKKQNKQFQQDMSDRNVDFANRISGNVFARREVIDPLYESIVEKINASVVMKSAQAGVEPFVCELNEKISYYENTLHIRHSRSKKSKNKPATGAS